MFDKDKKAKAPFIFSIQDELLSNLIIQNPEFKKLLTIRAFRRVRYFKKLFAQKNQWAQMRFKAALLGIKGKEFTKSNLEVNPARLTEESMSYESLVMYQNASDDEKT